MKTYLINLISGPGAGKTSLAALLFFKLKMKRFMVEYIQEVAKGLVWAEEYDVLNNQYWVSQRQFKLLNSLQGKVQFIITDGCLLHGIYYNRNNENNVSNIEKTEQFIIESYNKFNNINIFLTRGDYPYEQAGRYQDEEEARYIDAFYHHFLKKNNIPFSSFEANEDHNVDEMIDYILSIVKQDDLQS